MTVTFAPRRHTAAKPVLSQGALANAKRLLSLIWGDRLVRQVLFVMLGVTLAVILVFVLSGLWDDRLAVAEILHRNFHLSRDHSIAENFNHGIAFVTAFLLLASALTVRSRAFWFLTVLYGFVWLDDSARYHERFAKKLGHALDLRARYGLEAQDYGELLAWAIAGAVLAVVFLWAWSGRRRGDSGVLLLVFPCFALLIFCGVVVDMIHKWVPGSLYALFDVVEDGGEMIAVTLSAALAFGLLRQVEAYYAGFDAVSG